MTMHQVCPMWASVFIVPSASGEEQYMVKYFPTQKAVCTCPAYRFSGEYDNQTCKHIRIVKATGCFYMPFYDSKTANKMAAGPNDLDTASITLHSITKSNLTEKPCPSCGRPMIEVYT